MEKALQVQGFQVVNNGYPSTSEPIRALAPKVGEAVAQCGAQTVHFVTHSMGGILARVWLKDHKPEQMGRVVMLAPPNRPAEMARAFKDNPIYRWFTGESGQQLASEAFYETLPVPPVEFGIIAGDRGQRLTFREPNDGVVTVESTKLEGMKAWALVHHAHTFIMNSRQVALLCMQFLRHGNFDLPPGLAENQGEMSGDSHRLTPDDPADD